MKSSLMKALQFDRSGTLDALALRDIKMPTPTREDVLVKIYAAGVNPSDVKNVLGRFPYTTLPRIPGRDFSGIVVEGSVEWRGKEVWGSGKGIGFTRDGAHAEYLTFPTEGLSLKPLSLNFAQAASCGVPYITALEALERSNVKANTRLLVIGAAGAVGSAALAIAKMRGATMLAAVRKPAQQISLQQQGIASILLTDEASLAASVQQHFSAGADVIFDTTGMWLAASVSALHVHGSIAVIAAPIDGVSAFPLLDFYRRGGNLVGVNSLLHDTASCAAMLNKLREGFDSGALAAPDNIRECSLDEGLQVYADVNRGSDKKCVFVNCSNGKPL